MYRCQKCERNVGPGESANFVVTAIRERQYTVRRRVRSRGRGDRDRDRGSSGGATWVDQPAGEGWERVKELMVCSECERRLREEHPEPEVIRSGPAPEPTLADELAAAVVDDKPEAAEA